MKAYVYSTLIAIGLWAAAPASAQNLVVYGGAALVFDKSPDGAGSADTLAFQPYVEAELNHIYAGLWLSKSSDQMADEVDIYLGYRNETAGEMSYDFGYTRYFYPNDGGDCCGELTLSLGVSPSDKLSLSIDAAADPEAKTGSAQIGASYALTDAFSLASKVGFVGSGGGQEWELGATYVVNDTSSVDLHFYDGTDYAGYLELSLSFDTTLFSR